ncbi:hypothetical protein [Mesorhizobium sp.]|uniref:hypothetical protein n=1 Tax=Mesorhizobium sp. TaxID=1871066 RepID=UPI0025EC0410|nr:hypothetical protein [Mesorhizobium sp.]
MKIMMIGMALAMLALTGAAQAAGCVDAESAKAGFVLEKPGIRSEFRPAPGGMVSVANSYQSQSPQTQYLYAGLIEVFRDSDTGRLSMIPLGDIRKLFPLKAGAKSKTEFVRGAEGHRNGGPYGQGQGKLQTRRLHVQCAGGERNDHRRFRGGHRYLHRALLTRSAGRASPPLR